MAIYHFHVAMVSRSSGRSSVAATAYRAGEKLRNNRDGVTHDYRQRKDVIHTEILLPNNAPREYQDRLTLWNAVEEAEKRIDAQTAREMNISLPIELSHDEQTVLLRKFITKNFVEHGMIADFALHDKGEGAVACNQIKDLGKPCTVPSFEGPFNEPNQRFGVSVTVDRIKDSDSTANPHAHIMLTTRGVGRDGFGKKNRNWNSKPQLLTWRKDWAVRCNEKFIEKGLTERIDHRTLAEQNIDREPTIHVGVAACALERRGIRTERGDVLRGVIARNKARESHENVAELLHEFKEGYIIADRELSRLQQESASNRQMAMREYHTAEEIEEKAKNIQVLDARVAELQ
ncbi:MAG: MobA/MobL family protein, partial [Christensenellaceae bacterium]|nr:MobA/MobL family protein [Christensenellaceae bacterium]